MPLDVCLREKMRLCEHRAPILLCNCILLRSWRSTSMNIANSIRRHYVFPTGGFVDFPDAGPYLEYADDGASSGPHVEQCASSDSGWRIDNSSFGTRLAVIPVSLGAIPPCRIELTLPDQLKWPPTLWSKLGARDSVHVTGTRINSLGVASYIRQALHRWSSSIHNFADVYLSLPFGSSIRAVSISVDPAEVEFELVPNKALVQPGVFLSTKELQALWRLDDTVIPPVVSYSDLIYQRHLANDAILVSSSVQGVRRLYVFKSSKNSPAYIYHEIKTLLSIPKTPTIIQPSHLVTFPREGAEPAVCGFLMHYYELGTLEDVLPERQKAGKLSLRQKSAWSHALITTLMHVQRSPAKFYSDLRMDQLLLSSGPDGSESIILIDFEQGRNVYNWAPPEIYYVEWLAELGTWEFARSDDLTAETMERFGEALSRYLKSRNHPGELEVSSLEYDNAPLGWYWPWLLSSPAEREAAMVYMLGKALWCLFEGIGDADVVLGRSGSNDGARRFPDFVHTPPQMQDLIRKCTAGAREWTDGPIAIYRREGRVYPLGKTGLNGEPEGTVEETKRAIREFWRGEMDKALAFVEARMRHDRGEALQGDANLLHYLQRPKLQEVLAAVEAFQRGIGAGSVAESKSWRVWRWFGWRNPLR
jgi:hypothetical protein